MKTLFIATVLIFSYNILATAQSFDETVEWQFESEQVSENTYKLKIVAKVHDDWYMYGRKFERGGPLPLEITFEENKAYLLEGEMEESKEPIIEEDEIFGITVHYFSGTVVFTQVIKTKSNNLSIPVSVSGQTCRKTSGVCIPVGTDYTFEL